MRNNNGGVVRKLVWNNLRQHGLQYRFVFLAIIISSMLLASVFSIGLSYYNSLNIQQLRLMGTSAHAGLSNPTEDQCAAIAKLEYIRDTGLSMYVAPVSGSRMLSLYWYDENEWNRFRKPALTNIVGEYPENENEIMGSLYALAQLGVSQPFIGQEISISYLNDQSILEKQFVISGYYNSDLHVRSDGQDFLLVSDAFASSVGISTRENGSLSILYKDNRNVDGYTQRLLVDAQVEKNQTLRMVPRYDVGDDAHRSNILSLGLIILFIVLTAFLLIHNIMGMTVSQQIRFFGQLKTLGTTSIQIKRFVMGNAFALCALGIPVGLLLAMAFSQTMVPFFVSKLGDLSYGVEVSFHPLIYLGAGLFSMLTVVLGAWKPARVAATFTPIEASRFTTGAQKGQQHASIGRGVWKMALRALCQDKLRTALVVVSLFLSMTLFSIVIGMIGSLDADQYAASAMESDFIIESATPDLAQRLAADPIYSEFQANYVEYMELESSAAFSDYLKTEKSSALVALDTADASSLVGYLVGIDDQALTNMGLPLGDYVYISTDRPDLFQDINVVTLSAMRTGNDGLEVVTQVTLPVGGFVPTAYRWASESIAPNIYVSNELLLKLIPDAEPYSVQFNVSDDQERSVYDTLTAEIAASSTMRLSSRIQAKERLRQMQSVLYLLGGGIAVLLGFVGLLNFVNILSASIVRRKVEFAILESIGMTKRQLRQQVIYEGASYAIIAILLFSTLGTTLTLILLNVFSSQVSYALCRYPVLPTLLIVIALILLSAVIPTILFQCSRKTSLIDRLRSVE